MDNELHGPRPAVPCLPCTLCNFAVVLAVVRVSVGLDGGEVDTRYRIRRGGDGVLPIYVLWHIMITLVLT